MDFFIKYHPFSLKVYLQNLQKVVTNYHDFFVCDKIHNELIFALKKRSIKINDK